MLTPGLCAEDSKMIEESELLICLAALVSPRGFVWQIRHKSPLIKGIMQ